jgi:predicted ATP-grasp superfamily ATP-dependent carboligase
MVSMQSPLMNKRVGVIGFNARPIACSAKKAGAHVFVSDYWGDEDLSRCCDDWVAILTPTPGARQRQPLDTPLYDSLVENLLHLTKEQDLDYILIGSGFDDHADALIELQKKGRIMGCTPNQMKRARDFSALARIADSLNFQIPKRLVADTPDEALKMSGEFKFPYMIRPTHSGGGSGIRLVRNYVDISKAFGEPVDEEYEPRVVQEYIRGVDISCSVLATPEQSLALSVQGQLIGFPSAGRNCDFAYCGNYYPSTLPQEVAKRVGEASEAICDKLRLSGSVGFDYVIDESDRIWLMEVNPRMQGTLEMFEAAGDLSVTSLHVLASQGMLPKSIPTIQPCVKMVVYSRRDGRVPNLSQYANTVDRTPPSVVVNIRDPICTVIEVGNSMMECYRRASETTLAIQSGVL